jgi:hypothetical protein
LCISSTAERRAFDSPTLLLLLLLTVIVKDARISIGLCVFAASGQLSAVDGWDGRDVVPATPPPGFSLPADKLAFRKLRFSDRTVALSCLADLHRNTGTRLALTHTHRTHTHTHTHTRLNVDYYHHIKTITRAINQRFRSSFSRRIAETRRIIYLFVWSV